MKRIVLTGKSSIRLCPTCRRIVRITITDTGDGCASWQCHECGASWQPETTSPAWEEYTNNYRELPY